MELCLIKKFKKLIYDETIDAIIFTLEIIK